MTATVVLVHGAWHDASCFERVTALLDAAGVKSIAIDLPGHGKDPGPFTDLHGDSRRLAEVIGAVDGDVIVLGHSYGGMVISQLEHDDKIRHLVFLAAVVLDVGETGSTAGWFDPAIVDVDLSGLDDPSRYYVRHADSITTIAPEGIRPLLYNDCDDATVAWASQHVGAHPMATFRQETTNALWKTVESTYVVCTNDAMLHPNLQRHLAKRATHTIEWPTGHCPNVSEPRRVADLLIELAGR